MITIKSIFLGYKPKVIVQSLYAAINYLSIYSARAQPFYFNYTTNAC